MRKQWSLWVVAGATAIVLAACGGGEGGSSTSPALETSAGQGTDTGIAGNSASVATPFLGIWQVDQVCTNNWELVPASEQKNGGSLRVEKLEIFETKLIQTTVIYGDRNCSQPIGRVIENYDLSWSAASTPGWSKAARIKATFNGYEASASLLLVPSEGEALGNVRKMLVGAKISATYEQLYIGSSQVPVDMDGYPTDFPPYPYGIRDR
ncbi:hypothetical protein [Comamonas terrae]|uniref:Lipocalin-like domain-containing protein n=1 Tax=Comamonas terrae TaxID=673548 RepID=A0ABW5UUT2_9BURK|nr:hypothetical protein [Comamonas terrae]